MCLFPSPGIGYAHAGQGRESLLTRVSIKNRLRARGTGV